MRQIVLVALISLSCVLQGGNESTFKAPRFKDGWEPSVRAGLDSLIEMNRGNPDAYAVFDFDYTAAIGDLTYTCIWRLLERLDFRMESFVGVMTEGLPTDMAVEVAAIGKAIDRLKGESCAKLMADSEWKDLVIRYWMVYRRIFNELGEPFAVEWRARLFRGYTVAALRELALEAMERESKNGCIYRDANVPTEKRGLVIVPEIVDLFARLESAGIKVYVVSGARQSLLVPVVSKYLKIPNNQVFGSSEDGKGGVVNGQKADFIRWHIAPQHHWSDPVLVSGDSMGDYAMLTEFNKLQRALVFKRHYRDCPLADLIDDASKSNGRVLVQGRDEGRGCLIPSRDTIEPFPLKVAVFADRGVSGIGAVDWFRIVSDSPDMMLKLVDGKSIRAGALDGQDMLIMPGGYSNYSFESLGPEGIRRMKEYVLKGGAYLGTCGGCYLIMDGEKNCMRMMPWNRTGAEKDLFFPMFNVNEAGAKALRISPGNHRMRYHGGPFMWPTTNLIKGAKLELWGTFNAQASFNGPVSPKKRMFGAAAILGGTYGKGKVFVTAAHPEYFESTHYIVKAAIRYLTGREVVFAEYQRRPGAVALGFYTKDIAGIETAQLALRLAGDKRVDFQPVDNDGLWEGRLRHIEILVIPSKIPAGSPVMEAIDRMIRNGGRVALIGAGEENEIEGAVRCASCEELFELTGFGL